MKDTKRVSADRDEGKQIYSGSNSSQVRQNINHVEARELYQSKLEDGDENGWEGDGRGNII